LLFYPLTLTLFQERSYPTHIKSNCRAIPLLAIRGEDKITPLSLRERIKVRWT